MWTHSLKGILNATINKKQLKQLKNKSNRQVEILLPPRGSPNGFHGRHDLRDVSARTKEAQANKIVSNFLTARGPWEFGTGNTWEKHS